MAFSGKRIGEVIESSTTQFTAECIERECVPPFGSLVVAVSDYEVYGLVFEVRTVSVDPGRRPMAYGKTEEELMMEQPQIFELLRTEFQAVICGYRDREGVRQALPPTPPRIHSFVYPCDLEGVRDFTSSFDFLRMLFSSYLRIPIDELIIASLRNAYLARDGDPSYLIKAGKELSKLLGDDYERLNSIFRRIGR